MGSFHILILDESPHDLGLISSLLEKHNFKIFLAANHSKARQLLNAHSIDIILINIGSQQADQFIFLDELTSSFPSADVITMSNSKDINLVIKSFLSGACDFIQKPLTEEKLITALRRTEKYNQSLSNKANRPRQWSLISSSLKNTIGHDFIGRSYKIKEVIRLAELVATEKDMNILITGENGTGKEIIARIIHYSSQRKQNRFCPVNCAAVPETLIESEFFGHKKGTFTGAIEDKKGCFEQAHEGTLFLDEISEMPFALQAKLLRAIEEKRIKPLGSNKEKQFNFRIISATNAQPHKLIKDKKLRIDLFHRLSTFILHIPPLRERLEDITPLTCFFVNQISERRQENQKWIEPDVFQGLKSYPFPGNVRELKNLTERAMLFANHSPLSFEHFTIPDQFHEPFQEIESNLNIEENEKRLIANALIKCNFNASNAAKLLGISRDTLIRKKKKFNIINNSSFLASPPEL